MDETILTRIKPNSLEAEQSVIGSMIMDKDAISTAMEILRKEDFYHNQYGIVFEAMAELYDAGSPVDIVTLQSKLKEKDVPENISNMGFVRDLVTAVPTSANIRYYANIVREHAIKRHLIEVMDDIENDCYAGKESVESIMDKTEKNIFKMLNTGGSDDFVPIRTVTMNVLEEIEKASQTSGSVTGLPTGFLDLDYRTAGLQPSDMILIAARPSMGKTAFVLNIAQHICFYENKNAVIFSLEMSNEQLVNRLLALEAKVDSQAIRTGNLSDADWEKLVEAAGVIGNSKLIIDDTPGITLQELRSKCRKYAVENGGIDIIIIDYLQLMSGPGRGESRQQEVSDISRGLKALARELNCPVVALSQLSRAVEQRPDHRPMLSDLRESGAIEQDADLVMFIYRDDYYNKETADKNVSEIIIAKQRRGPIGTIKLAWLPQYTKFANLQHDKYQQEQ